MSRLYQFPLQQHIGAKAAPAIVEGDNVVRGQLIASKGENILGANIHTSVTGVVEAVSEDLITIRVSGEQSEDFVKLSGETPLERIEEAGIVGLGGAGFPTYAKLSKPFSDSGVVIVNAAECEPILSHNIYCIEQNPKQLLRGLQIVMEIVNADKGYIAIKQKHTKAINELNRYLEDENIQIAALPDMYPMGEERAIVREVLGKLLPVDSIPLMANAIVINAETVCRVQEAVDFRKPLIDKNMTVAGKLAGNTNLVQVFQDIPIGTSVQTVFDMAGGVKDGYGELIMGGPFTGRRTTMESPVIKTTGGLIATECFFKGPDKIGLLVCACGADKERLSQIAKSMGSEVVGVEYCKQAKPVKAALKCENPGKCPGQVGKIMELKKAGAKAVLISNCTDCSNTVMSCAPKMGLPVYHCTDQALRAVNEKLIRRIRS